MHDRESIAFKRSIAGLLARRDSHDIAGRQFRVVTDRRLALHGHRPEPEQVLRLLARQSERQSGQVWQELAPAGDLELALDGHLDARSLMLSLLMFSLLERFD
jgi:hypothetical protein